MLSFCSPTVRYLKLLCSIKRVRSNNKEPVPKLLEFDSDLQQTSSTGRAQIMSCFRNFFHLICAASQSTQESCYGLPSRITCTHVLRVCGCVLSFFFFFLIHVNSKCNQTFSMQWVSDGRVQPIRRFLSFYAPPSRSTALFTWYCSQMWISFVFLRGYYDMMWPIPEITLHGPVGFSIFALGFYPPKNPQTNIDIHLIRE